MTIKMIVAVDRANAIGWQDGRLPWKIPADLKRFKELTTGQTVLMGRKTFESLGRPDGLPNRHNLVFTQQDTCPEDREHVKFFRGNEAYSMIECALLHKMVTGPDQDLWVIGGAQIYKQFLDAKVIDEIFLTVVDTDSGADVTLSHDLSNWKLFVLGQRKDGVEWSHSISEHQYTEEGLGYTFVTLTKTK